MWRFRTGELLVACCQGGIYRELGRIALPGLDTACWFRLRVEAEQGTLSTYLNDILVDTRQDATFTVGGVAFCGEGVGLVRELYIYRYAPGEQKRATYEVAGTQTALRMDSAHGEFGFFSPETTWQPENMKVWQFRPFRAGWGEIADYEATITRKDFDRDVTGLTHLQVVMTNRTPRPEVWLEFTADGETWHRKGFSTACMDASQHPLWRVLYPAFTPYVLDMRDTPAWTGRITGLRLRFAAGFGTVAVKTVTLFAPEIGEEYTDCFRA